MASPGTIVDTLRVHCMEPGQYMAYLLGRTAAYVLVQVEAGINAVLGPNTTHVRIAREDLDASESIPEESVGCDKTSHASTDHNY